jgi:hypothetical protein
MQKRSMRRGCRCFGDVGLFEGRFSELFPDWPRRIALECRDKTR